MAASPMNIISVVHLTLRRVHNEKREHGGKVQDVFDEIIAGAAAVVLVAAAAAEVAARATAAGGSGSDAASGAAGQMSIMFFQGIDWSVPTFIVMSGCVLRGVALALSERSAPKSAVRYAHARFGRAIAPWLLSRRVASTA